MRLNEALIAACKKHAIPYRLDSDGIVRMVRGGWRKLKHEQIKGEIVKAEV